MVLQRVDWADEIANRVGVGQLVNPDVDWADAGRRVSVRTVGPVDPGVDVRDVDPVKLSCSAAGSAQVGR